MNSLELADSLGFSAAELAKVAAEIDAGVRSASALHDVPQSPISLAIGQSYSRDDVVRLARNDLNFLAGLSMPEVFQFNFPSTYLAMWEWITTYIFKERDFSKLAVGLPRGFAKTTFIKIFLLFVILFTTRKFILIISSKEQHAKNIISDVLGLLSEPNITRVFGDFTLARTIDKQELQVFSFCGRTITLAAFGRDGSIRGLSLGIGRPDVMLFDDYQTREDSESADLSKKHIQRLTGTIMKAKAPTGCMFLYIANMYNTPGCILKKLKATPQWLKFIVGGILADGTSLWPELQPLEQLLEEWRHDKAMGEEAIFLAEILNDQDAGLKSGVDLELINISEYSDQYDKHDGHFIVIDPGGQKATSDLAAIGYFRIYDGSKKVFHTAIQGHWSPLGLIHRALILALTTRCSLIAVENVAYQDTLLFWFDHILKLHPEISGFYFVPINPKAKSKTFRIRTYLSELVSDKKESQLHPRMSVLVKDQIRAWNPLAERNVDELLDLGAYSHQVIQEHPILCSVENAPLVVIENQASLGVSSVLPSYLTSPV